MPEQETIQPKTMVHIGTRVTDDLEKEILKMANADRRKLSPMVALMLEEYLEVRKIMAANKLTMPNISVSGMAHIESDKIDDQGDSFYRLTWTDGLTDKIIDLEKSEVEKLAANLFTFLIECNLNG